MDFIARGHASKSFVLDFGAQNRPRDKALGLSHVEYDSRPTTSSWRAEKKNTRGGYFPGTLPEELICEAWMLFTSTYNIQ
jgi:hypothetical protein